MASRGLDRILSATDGGLTYAVAIVWLWYVSSWFAIFISVGCVLGVELSARFTESRRPVRAHEDVAARRGQYNKPARVTVMTRDLQR